MFAYFHVQKSSSDWNIKKIKRTLFWHRSCRHLNINARTYLRTPYSTPHHVVWISVPWNLSSGRNQQSQGVKSVLYGKWRTFREKFEEEVLMPRSFKKFTTIWEYRLAHFRDPVVCKNDGTTWLIVISNNRTWNSGPQRQHLGLKHHRNRRRLYNNITRCLSQLCVFRM